MKKYLAIIRLYGITSFVSMLDNIMVGQIGTEEMSGVAILTSCYAIRGLSVIAGLNIANTINNVFNVVFFTVGDAVEIIIGQLLGAGKMEEARDTDNKK